MQKIIFVLTNLQDPHALKRIQEFAERGYDFEVYGFSRDIGFGNQISIPYTELGKMTNGTGYFSRLKFLGPVLRKLVRKYKNDDVVFYCFSLEMAFFVRLFSSKAITREFFFLTTKSKNFLIVRPLAKSLVRFFQIC